MNVGDLLFKSWQEYKKNFKLSLNAFWWFKILPSVILWGIILVLLLSFAKPVLTFFLNPSYLNYSINSLDVNSNSGIQNIPANLEGSLRNTNLFGITGNAIDVGNFGDSNIIGVIVLIVISIIVAWLILSILNIILSLTIYYISIYNEKGNMSFKEAVKGGVRYFWKFVGLAFLIFIILLLLYVPMGITILLSVLSFTLGSTPLGVLFILISVLLFIGALIFTIYFAISWIFSTFVLIRENTGIKESMRRSRLIVKGRWWKVLGYMLLMGLIVYLIGLVFAIPSYVLQTLNPVINGSSGVILMVVNYIVNYALTLIAEIITIPLTIFYLKNFYLDLRKGVNPITLQNSNPQNLKNPRSNKNL